MPIRCYPSEIMASNDKNNLYRQKQHNGTVIFFVYHYIHDEQGFPILTWRKDFKSDAVRARLYFDSLPKIERNFI